LAVDASDLGEYPLDIAALADERRDHGLAAATADAGAGQHRDLEDDRRVPALHPGHERADEILVQDPPVDPLPARMRGTDTDALARDQQGGVSDAEEAPALRHEFAEAQLSLGIRMQLPIHLVDQL